jgi:hypothetical protein
MKLLTLEKSFRAVLRAHYPQNPDLADYVTLRDMQQCPRDPATGLPIGEEARAAFKASDDLKAAIIDGRIRLHGCLAGQLCGDISPAEITIPGRINEWECTLHVRQGRTYHDVCCSVDDIAALIGNIAAPSGVTKDKPAALSPTEACRALIEAHHSSNRSKSEIENDARAIPEFPISTFDSMWRDYASPYQKRPGARPRRAAGD